MACPGHRPLDDVRTDGVGQVYTEVIVKSNEFETDLGASPEAPRFSLSARFGIVMDVRVMDGRTEPAGLLSRKLPMPPFGGAPRPMKMLWAAGPGRGARWYLANERGGGRAGGRYAGWGPGRASGKLSTGVCAAQSVGRFGRLAAHGPTFRTIFRGVAHDLTGHHEG